MSHLRLIDEVALTFYCSGCHEHTQNLQHECSGQVDLLAGKASRMIHDDGATPYMMGTIRHHNVEVMALPIDVPTKTFKDYLLNNDWEVEIHNEQSLSFKRINTED